MVRKDKSVSPWMLMMSGWSLVAPGVIGLASGEAPAASVMIAAGAAIVAWAVTGFRAAKPARA